jgi:uncharacterized MAPEG superfamily protein
MVLNLSLLAIPAHYILSLAPHAYSVFAVNKALKPQQAEWDNVNPNGASHKALLAKHLPADVHARVERAESAHRNGLENLPLIASAILAANFAGVPVAEINALAATWLALRALYNVLYINTVRLSASRARSLTWFAGVVVTCTLFWKAATASA